MINGINVSVKSAQRQYQADGQRRFGQPAKKTTVRFTIKISAKGYASVAAKLLDTPKSQVHLFDRSSSMEWGDNINKAKMAANLAVENLSFRDECSVLCFTGKCDTTDLVVPLDFADMFFKKDAIKKIAEIKTGSGTNFLAALKRARKELVKSKCPRKIIFMLTDGLDTSGEDIAAYCRELRKEGIVVYCGGLGVRNSHHKALKEIFGQGFVILTPDMLVDFFVNLQNQASISLVHNAIFSFETGRKDVSVSTFEMLTRNTMGAYEYVGQPGKLNALGVLDIMANDSIRCLLELEIDQPIKPCIMDVGKLFLTGIDPMTGQEVTVHEEMLQVAFTDNPDVTQDPELEAYLKTADILRNMQRVSESSDFSVSKSCLQHVIEISKDFATNATSPIVDRATSLLEQIEKAANLDSTASESRSAISYYDPVQVSNTMVNLKAILNERKSNK